MVWCGDLAGGETISAGWPAAESGDQWEALLDHTLADVVIIGREGGREGATHGLRCEQVSQLTKNGVTCLTTFPLVDSVLAYYEIDMARGESNTILQHFNPLTQQRSVIDACASWIGEGHPELGSIEQVVWERPLAERTQAKVLWHFSRDVEFLALVAGRLNRLGALGSPDEAATYAGLSVQLLGKSEVPVRWQVGPIEGDSDARLVLIAQQGKVTVTFDESGQAWQLSVSQQGKTTAEQLEAVDAAAQAIERLALPTEHNRGATSTWPAALNAMELADTIEISLRRGRMIEVHQQQLTEQLAFKGTMSAFGCGVLMVLPPLLLFGGWLAELVGLPIAKFWPHVLLVLLGLFLAVQLIPKLLFRSEERES